MGSHGHKPRKGALLVPLFLPVCRASMGDAHLQVRRSIKVKSHQESSINRPQTREGARAFDCSWWHRRNNDPPPSDQVHSLDKTWHCACESHHSCRKGFSLLECNLHGVWDGICRMAIFSISSQSDKLNL